MKSIVELSRPARLAIAGAIISLLAGPTLLVVTAPAEAAGPVFRVGSYAGTGLAQSIAGVGFQPDAVIVKNSTSAGQAVARTSSMPANSYKNLYAGTHTTAGSRFTALDSDGFSLGTNADVNAASTTYYYTAWKATAGYMAVGTYTGDGSGSRNITGLGFDPGYVIVLNQTTASLPYQRSSSMSSSYSFPPTTADANAITALGSGQFTVNSTCNVNTTVYHYIAFAAVSQKAVMGSYAGSGSAADVNVGIFPGYLILKAVDTPTVNLKSVQSSLSLATNYSMYFDSAPNSNDHITGLRYDGFSVSAGSGTNVANDTAAGNANHYIAFSPYWDSYSDSGYATMADSFSGASATVYMQGILANSGSYQVTYYDGNGILVQTDAGLAAGSNGVLRPTALTLSNKGAYASGDWHAVVQGNGATIPTTYSDATSNLHARGVLAIDTFNVAASALPEFPGTYAALAATVLCLGVFWLLRRKALPRGASPGRSIA